MGQNEKHPTTQASKTIVEDEPVACDSEEAKQKDGDLDTENTSSGEGDDSPSDPTGAESAFSVGSDAYFSDDRDSKETKFWKRFTQLILLVTAIAMILVMINLADEVNACAEILFCAVLFIAVLMSIWFTFVGEEILCCLWEKLKSFSKRLWSLLKGSRDFLKKLWDLLRRPKDLLERLQGLLGSAESLLERLKSQLKELMKKIFRPKTLIILVLAVIVVVSEIALASAIEPDDISAFIIVVLCSLFMAFAVGMCICWKPDKPEETRERAIGVATIASVTGILLTVALAFTSTNQTLSDCTCESCSSNELLTDTYQDEPYN